MSLTLGTGMILDAALGEPKWLWSHLQHPVVYVGRMISFLDSRLNDGTMGKAKGLVLLTVLILSGLTLGAVIAKMGTLFEIFAIFVFLAQRSLMDHVSEVAQALRISLDDGREAVAKIVGRDTAQMSESDVIRAAIESAAENFSDGVIAPLFWYLILGLPGLLAFKFVNTGDSMVGYKTPKYMDFGWATARFDDVLNWVPARLTALLISLPLIWQRQTTLFAKIKADAALHRSPNAGWPEAALAYTLDIALSGPRWYHGTQQKYPWVNAGGKQRLNPHDIDRVTHMIWKTWGICVCIIFAMALL